MGFNLADIIPGGLVESVGGLIGKFKADPTEKARLAAALDERAADFRLAELQINAAIDKALVEQVTAQIKVNEADAKGNWYQAGWRPSCGYVCVIGLLYQFLLQPLMAWLSLLWGKPIPPVIDIASLLTLLLGMLGISAMRTTEKLKDKD